MLAVNDRRPRPTFYCEPPFYLRTSDLATLLRRCSPAFACFAAALQLWLPHGRRHPPLLFRRELEDVVDQQLAVVPVIALERRWVGPENTQ